MRELISQKLLPLCKSVAVLLLLVKPVYGFPAAINSTLTSCLTESVDLDVARAQFPFEAQYYKDDVHPYNYNFNRTPKAVMYPYNAKEVAAIVSCALPFGLKVQARGGGHDLNNKALGKTNQSTIVVDLQNMKSIKLNENTGVASVGAGARLKDIVEALHTQGRRYMPHGASATVGIGGHAAIGGLGLHSRLVGTALDTMEAAEVVLANGTIANISNSNGADIFWAIRGAGASFGIVTEYAFQTSPEPEEVLNFEYVVASEEPAVLSEAFDVFQHIFANSTLDRRLSAISVIQKNRTTFSGAFFGPASEYSSYDLEKKIPGITNAAVYPALTWSEHMERLFAATGHLFPEQAFFDSLGTVIALDTMPSKKSVVETFQHMQTQDPGSENWFALVDVYGGAVNDVKTEATAFPHRNMAYIFAIYVTTDGVTTPVTNAYVDQAILTIQDFSPDKYSNYAGYGNLRTKHPQQAFWGPNLPRLNSIKLQVDPENVFSSMHGVEP
ncbi:hypothetical protein NM208_g1258 [Fusarium decemcellulare]|uniref:Uncharacterized protein n=1 Tax=Fusarium decemcellulare TaxID=57161 RepID=A0ACC1SWQ8_9HYPO|nr:hypothetical protein NM208_g1258 [Fusarium decemcellulare]